MSMDYNKDNERLGILTVVKDTECCGVFRPTDLYTYIYLKQKIHLYMNVCLRPKKSPK